MAAKHFAVVAADPNADTALKGMNAALMTSAEGDWVTSSEILRSVIEEDAENYVVGPSSLLFDFGSRRLMRWQGHQ
jgi:hypothetical protein